MTVGLPEELKGRKVSEVFWEYVEPYLKILIESKGTPAPLEEMTGALSIPCCVWNAIVVKNHSKSPHSVDYLAQLDRLIKDFPEETKNLIDLLKQRKMKLFNQYDYMLSECQFFCDQNNEVRLRAEARRFPKRGKIKKLPS